MPIQKAASVKKGTSAHWLQATKCIQIDNVLIQDRSSSGQSVLTLRA